MHATVKHRYDVFGMRHSPVNAIMTTVLQAYYYSQKQKDKETNMKQLMLVSFVETLG